MIVIRPTGAQDPMIGKVRGWESVSVNTVPLSVADAISLVIRSRQGERDGFLFVASGGRVNSARIYKALQGDWDIAVHVDRIGKTPSDPAPFSGIGKVSIQTVFVRQTEAAIRVIDRWRERNVSCRVGERHIDREAINLAIALAEMQYVRVLHLSSEWVWREQEMRPMLPSAQPVVDFSNLGEKVQITKQKISELMSGVTAPKDEPKRKPPPGVLWVGHLYQYTGYGKANREILLRLANSMSVRIDDSHNEPVYVREDLRSRLDAHKKVVVSAGAPLLRMMGPDYISQKGRHRIVWTMQETSERVHEDMVRRANANFDEIWAPTAWNLEVFRNSGIKLPGRVMPLGIDPVIFRPVGRKPLPPCRLISTSKRGLVASPQGFTFITVGLPGFRKGWDVIADAAELALTGKSKANIVIALTHSPAAWNEKVYKQFANYKVPIWTLEGSFDEHELAGIYCGADAYVSASRGEGFNLPAAEAAACGLPVILPDNTCHTEIFGPEALLFKPDGVKKYPEGDWISEWYKGQLFSKFGARATARLALLMSDVRGSRYKQANDLREKIIAKYTWDIAAARAAWRLMEVQQ